MQRAVSVYPNYKQPTPASPPDLFEFQCDDAVTGGKARKEENVSLHYPLETSLLNAHVPSVSLRHGVDLAFDSPVLMTPPGDDAMTVLYI